jgi:hypothetical protein
MGSRGRRLGPPCDPRHPLHVAAAVFEAPLAHAVVRLTRASRRSPESLQPPQPPVQLVPTGEILARRRADWRRDHREPINRRVSSTCAQRAELAVWRFAHPVEMASQVSAPWSPFSGSIVIENPGFT